jgi:hypothetical protein
VKVPHLSFLLTLITVQRKTVTIYFVRDPYFVPPGSGTLSGTKAETNDDAVSTSRSKSIQPNNLDLAIDKSNVDSQQKLILLKNKWVIPSSFVFPLTDIRGTKRRFNRSWLEKYQWLRYSESENGVFCLCCVLFNSSEHDYIVLLALLDRHKVFTHFKICCVQVDLSVALLGYPNLPRHLQNSYVTHACSELLNKTQHKQKTPFSDSEYLSH